MMGIEIFLFGILCSMCFDLMVLNIYIFVPLLQRITFGPALNVQQITRKILGYEIEICIVGVDCI